MKSEDGKAPEFLSDEGEVGERIRSFDWSATPLGPAGLWPPSLCAAVSQMLTDRPLSPDRANGAPTVPPMNAHLEAQLQQIFVQAPVGICILRGPQHVVESVNAPMLELLGKTAEQVTSKPLFEGVPDGAGQGFEQLLDHVYQQGERYVANETSVNLLRGGKTEKVYVNFVYEPLRETDGTVMGIIAVAVEVTEQVEARQKVEDAQARSRSLLKQAPMSIAVLSGPDRIVELANEATLRLWNKTEEELLHKPVFEVLPEAAGQGFEELLEHVFRQGETYTAFGVPVQYPRDGVPHTIYLDFTYQPFREADGSISGVISIANEVTELIETRRKLEESEANLRNLLQQAPFLAIIYRGPELRVELANAAMLEVMAKTWEEIANKPIAEMYPETAAQQGYDIHHRVLETGQREIVQERQISFNRNGKLYTGWYNSVHEPLRDITGAVVGVIGVSHEVTEQVQARQKIEESEQRYRALSDELEQKVQERTYELAEMNEAFEHAETISSMGNFKWDFQANTISWSKGMYAIYGVTPETFTPALNNIMQFTHPEEVERVTANALKSFETETALPLGYRIIAADGGVKHVFGSGVILTDAAGGKVLVGTLQDVTADKEKEQQLIEANEELQRKNQEIAVSKYNKRFLTDFSERFSVYQVHTEFFNSLVQYIADLTRMDYVLVGRLEETAPEEFCVHTIAITAFGKLADNLLYPLPDGPCEQVVLGKIYSYPQDCRITFPKNQTLVQFNVEGYIGYPLYDLNGQAKGLIAVMHEQKIEDPETVSSILKIVAKRAEMELERIRHEQELQQSNQLLAEKNADLERSNHELEQFAYIASHDLQEPLRKIRTFTGMLQKKLGDGGEPEVFLEKINSSAARMSDLIKDVLDYSRLSRSNDKFVETDLNQILEQVKTDLELTIEQTRAVIHHFRLPVVTGVPLQLNQLFSNLLSNALKYSKQKPIVHITSQELSADEAKKHPQLNPSQGYFQITFSDNGIGFEQQYAEMIFNIFQRLHNKESYAGTGIGLAICKKIVELHGGVITAHGKPGEGAVFTVWLPYSLG